MPRFRTAFHRQQAPWGGVLLEILGGGVPPGSRNPDRISDKKNLIYHTRFQTQAFGRNYVIITYIRAQTKEFFKNISNSHISLFFLLIWNRKDKCVHTLLVAPQKPCPNPDQSGQSVFPFSDQNGAKTLHDGAAHTNLDPRALFPTSKAREKRPGDEVRNIPIYIHSFIHSFFFLPLTRNTTIVYRDTLR